MPKTKPISRRGLFMLKLGILLKWTRRDRSLPFPIVLLSFSLGYAGTRKCPYLSWVPLGHVGEFPGRRDSASLRFEIPTVDADRRQDRGTTGMLGSRVEVRPSSSVCCQLRATSLSGSWFPQIPTIHVPMPWW